MRLTTIRDMALGALVAGAISPVWAALVGIVPHSGPQLIDGDYVVGLAQGNNFTYQSGITALGTTAANATALNPNTYMIEIDTAASGTGVLLPFAIASDVLLLRNNGANNVVIYAQTATNSATGSVDTVNGGASITLNAGKSTICFAAKNGVYSCLGSNGIT